MATCQTFAQGHPLLSGLRTPRSPAYGPEPWGSHLHVFALCHGASVTKPKCFGCWRSDAGFCRAGTAPGPDLIAGTWLPLSFTFSSFPWKLLAVRTSGVNAQLTPTANSPCSHTAREARSIMEASGFQSLFALLRRTCRKLTPAGVRSLRWSVFGTAELNTAGNKRAATEDLPTTLAGLSALAAALGQPLPLFPAKTLRRPTAMRRVTSATSVEPGQEQGWCRLRI